jgi:hypothetical protein
MTRNRSSCRIGSGVDRGRAVGVTLGVGVALGVGVTAGVGHAGAEPVAAGALGDAGASVAVPFASADAGADPAGVAAGPAPEPHAARMTAKATAAPTWRMTTFLRIPG